MNKMPNNLFEDKNISNKPAGFNSPPKSLINIYSFLAILLVIIPEWIAESIITIENKTNSYDNLKRNNEVWNNNLELKLSAMSLKDLRETASKLNLQGYSRENRMTLYSRLLKKLSKN